MMPTDSRAITIALAGNPNSGKTSLFNQLTGARAHVGNYPGVTVEKKEGRIKHRGRDIHVVDLPGTYSLTAYSLEELVARTYILEEKPDLVIDVVDAANLERNLYLAVQFMEIGVPVVIALNMMDLVEGRGLKFDLNRLSELLGAPVVPTIARVGKGMEELLDAAVSMADHTDEWSSKRIRYGPDLDVRIQEISKILKTGRLDTEGYPVRWLSIKALEGDQEVLDFLKKDQAVYGRITEVVDGVARHLRATVDDEPEGVIADHRYGFITSVTKQAVTTVRDIRRTVTDKIDLVLLNRLVGPLILLAVLYAAYQFTFKAADAPVVWCEIFFSWLSDSVSSVLPEGAFRSLLVSGVIDGVGGVLGFVPLIGLMFFTIAILEDTGYMARIAFIMDRVLRAFGLHGSSVLALMIGGGITGGCAVPGVMAARTLRDPKERLATILVTPFMNCGAKLPVYAVLIAAFFHGRRADMMFLLTLIAWIIALTAARILRWTLLKGEHTPFVMELPPYRLPTLTGLLIHTWERVWQYIKKAGTVILAISILMWTIMTYPGLPESRERVFIHQAGTIEAALSASWPAYWPDRRGIEAFSAYLDEFRSSQGRPDQAPARDFYPDLAGAVSTLEDGGPDKDLGPYTEPAKAYVRMTESMALLEAARAGAGLRNSIAGRLGLMMEKVTGPLGFDWRTNIALTGGFAAKEVIVSTLGTAYSLSGQPDQERSLAQRLAEEGTWNPLTGFALMLFVMMYSPCVATLAIIGKEVGWRWAAFAMVYTTVAAYGVALAVIQVGRSMGLGV